MELLLIRHALPVRQEVEDGRADPELAPEGERQAAALAAWLRDERVDALYASPLVRARATAAPIEQALGLVAAVDDGLAEWDRDTSTYIPMEELKASDDGTWEAMVAGGLDGLGIDVDAFRSRVLTTIDAIADRHPGERVAVVCHGGVINAYTARVLGLNALLFFEPTYTSISRVLVSRTGVRSLRSLNEAGHLRAAPAP